MRIAKQRRHRTGIKQPFRINLVRATKANQNQRGAHFANADTDRRRVGRGIGIVGEISRQLFGPVESGGKIAKPLRTLDSLAVSTDRGLFC